MSPPGIPPPPPGERLAPFEPDEGRREPSEPEASAVPKRQGGARHPRPQGEARRAQRHASRTGSTYAAFLRHLCAIGGLERAVAECAAVAVLGALERRIPPDEAHDLEAQLPRKLVEFLPRQGPRPGRPVHRFGREDFLASVAEDLALGPGRAPDLDVERVVRAVFAALRDQISEGEADDIHANLPADLQDLWRLTQ